MRRPLDLPAALWPPLAAFGGLVYVSPAAAAATTAVAASAIAFIAAQPSMIMAAVALALTAVPKAGFTIGGFSSGFAISGFPVPVIMIALLAALPLLRQLGTRATVRPVAILALAWMLLRMVVMVFDGGEPGDLAALAGWYGVPLVLIVAGPALGSLRGDAGRRWVRFLELGMLGAFAFGMMQWVFGVTRVSIPGLTHALGTDLAEKPLLFAGGSKIPSTYQNGNTLGVITAFFFLIAVDRVLATGGSRRDRVLLVAMAVTTMLSGSRTAVLGMAVGLIMVVLSSRASHRTAGVGVGVGLTLVAVLAFSPSLSDRILGTTIQDPNVVVRAEDWSDVLTSVSAVELATGGSAWVEDYPVPGLAEGLIGAVQQVGVIGMALFLAVFIGAVRGREDRRWLLLLIPVAVSLAVDSAYLVFPTLFIPLARMFSPLYDEEPTTLVPQDETELAGVGGMLR